MFKSDNQNSHDRFDSLYEMATEAFEDGDFEAVERHVNQARVVALELGAEGRRQLAACLNLLGAACAETDRQAKAGELASQAYQILAEESLEPDEDLFGVASNAARFLTLGGKVAEGSQMYERARKHAIEQGEPMLAAITYIRQANNLIATGAPKEDVTPLLVKGMEAAVADTHGDYLFEAAGGAASAYYSIGEKEAALETLRKAIDRMDTIYRIPVDPAEKENPAWVLDYGAARSIVFRENYQESGVDPIPMNQLRLLLADMLLESDMLDEAIENFQRLDAQLQLEAERKGSEDEEDFEDEDDELEIEEDEAESEDDDGEADFDDEEEGESEDDDLEDEHYFDRARFYMSYGAALHLKGREQGQKSLLLRSRELFDLASGFVEFSEDDADDLEQEIAECLRAVDKDIAQI